MLLLHPDRSGLLEHGLVYVGSENYVELEDVLLTPDGFRGKCRGSINGATGLELISACYHKQDNEPEPDEYAARANKVRKTRQMKGKNYLQHLFE